MTHTKKDRHNAVLWFYQQEMENPAQTQSPLVTLVLEQKPQLEAQCQAALSHNNWQRLPPLVQIILVVATAELTANKDAKGRIISDYLNIARSYLEPSQLGLINGVLNKICGEWKPT